MEIIILRYVRPEQHPIRIEIYTESNHGRGAYDTWEEARQGLRDFNYDFLFDNGKDDGEEHFEIWAKRIERIPTKPVKKDDANSERDRVLALIEKELQGWRDVIAQPGNTNGNLWMVESTLIRLKRQVKEGLKADDVE